MLDSEPPPTRKKRQSRCWKRNCIAIDSECSKMDNSEKRVGRENTFKDLYILGILIFFCKYLWKYSIYYSFSRCLLSLYLLKVSAGGGQFGGICVDGCLDSPAPLDTPPNVCSVFEPGTPCRLIRNKLCIFRHGSKKKGRLGSPYRIRAQSTTSYY